MNKTWKKSICQLFHEIKIFLDFFSNRGFLRRRKPLSKWNKNSNQKKKNKKKKNIGKWFCGGTELVLIGKGRYVKGRVTLPTGPFRHLVQLLCLFKYCLRRGSLVGKNDEFRVQKMEAELKAAAHFSPQCPTQFAPFFVVAPVLCPFSPIKSLVPEWTSVPIIWPAIQVCDHWQHDVTRKWLPSEKLNKFN